MSKPVENQPKHEILRPCSDTRVVVEETWSCAPFALRAACVRRSMALPSLGTGLPSSSGVFHLSVSHLPIQSGAVHPWNAAFS